jgi:predicted ATPase
MLTSIDHDKTAVNILPENFDNYSRNVFTAIVGKNGVGKSRLLSNIVKASTASTLSDLGDPNSGRFVIAISTNLFDKFPLPDRYRDRANQNYKYVGVRSDVMASRSATGLIASAAKGLLEKICFEDDINLSSAFRALQFDSTIELTLKPTLVEIGRYRANPEIRVKSKFLAELQEILSVNGGIGIALRNEFPDWKDEQLELIASSIEILGQQFIAGKSFRLLVDLQTNECRLDGERIDRRKIEAIHYLIGTKNLLRFMDIRLNKLGHGELSLRLASSGEQCMMIMLLGIAGHIKNGALIVIDEPEVSLHPRWQEEFMPLLESCFESYSGCQFIIATHSPQIISRMSSDNSYILSLSNRELHCAKDFNRKSADYQLAELFDAPGLMNEYISRSGFNLIAKLNSRKVIDDEIASEMSKLLELKTKLESGDPVIGLIASVEGLFAHYASNK